MAPKQRSRGATSKWKSNLVPTRRSTRRKAQDDTNIPDVYLSMLDDLPDEEVPFDRPAKRRRASPEDNSVLPRSTVSAEFHPSGISDTSTDHVLERREAVLIGEKFVVNSTEAPHQKSGCTPEKLNSANRHRRISPPTTPPPVGAEQTIYDDSVTDSDESAEFEDVELGGNRFTGHSNSSSTVNRAAGPVTINLDTPSKLVPRRKHITKADRLHRLAVHKWHYLCLLLHMATVNQWCNDAGVQTSLKRLIPRKLISRLHQHGTQAERKFAFDKSMTDISDIWQSSFNISEPGVKRAVWRDSNTIDLAAEMENAPEPVDFEDFAETAKASLKSGKMRGSPDLGAQLFCALCRALAVDTRLICSLQVLPFSMAGEKSSTRSTDSYIQAGAQDFGTSTRLNGRDRLPQTIYPVWWVEVLNPAIDQWIALDPDSRHSSYNQPRTHYEPPASDALNSMSYVISFEENGTAKDVTQRYASAFNAKTRKTRVESTKGGEDWLNKVMSFLTKKEPEVRDQIEDAELHRRVALEGMPKSVQDFKDHPIYVLERHLRSFDAIHPKKECGRFKVGKDKVEIVYRRENVHACRTADGWYRRGRNVSDGQQELLRVINRRAAHDESGNEQGVLLLYAEFQTEVFVPPEIHNGHVPRNMYGNLDVYVPSMIPRGGCHVRHPFAVKAAKALGIDYAEAVTGFKFKGRQGTAVLDGVVVAIEHLAIITEVTSTIEEEAIEDTEDATDAILERLWAGMMRSLRVQEVVQERYGGIPTQEEAIQKVAVYNDTDDDDDEAGLEDADEPDDEDGLTYADTDAGGGFAVEAVEATAETRAEEAAALSTFRDNKPITLPTPAIRQNIVVVLSPHKEVLKSTLSQAEAYNDLFDGEPEEFPKSISVRAPANSLDRGGMTTEHGNDDEISVEGGGFVVSAGNSPRPLDLGEEYIPEIIKSSDPISTPDYPGVTLMHAEIDDASRRLQERHSKISQTPVEELGGLETKTEIDDDEDETLSLPSHDPDEDDLEPDWVETF